AYIGGSWTALSTASGTIDISDDTNLEAGFGITLTDDTVSVQDIYVRTAGDTMNGNLEIATSSVPAIIINPLAGDSEFYISIKNDGEGDDDDLFRIGNGTSPGTNPLITLSTTGTLSIIGDVIMYPTAGNPSGLSTSTPVRVPLIQQKDMTLLEPDQVRSVNNHIPMFTVDTYNYPQGIEITAVRIITSANATYQTDVEEWTDPDSATGTETTIVNIQSHNGGAADNENTETTASLTDTTVAAGSYVVLELNDAEDVDWVKLTVYYYVR
ncbi:MAG: hypothetical protein KBD53_07725, partial [Candidatus Omnitrophica bacterium]|nr:hypothetical protein [Candidatus Omnitrophota bacterium]